MPLDWNLFTKIITLFPLIAGAILIIYGLIKNEASLINYYNIIIYALLASGVAFLACKFTYLISSRGYSGVKRIDSRTFGCSLIFFILLVLILIELLKIQFPFPE